MHARPTTASTRPRLALVALLVTCLTSAVLVAPASAKPKGGGGKTVDATSSGFKVAKTKKAAGGFIGARKVGADVVYRVDPDKRATAAGFLPGAYTDSLTGSGKLAPSTEATSRAAWIVAKYGSFPSKVQNAAVEVALDDLLVGGPWAVKGKKAKARLAQVPKGARKKILKQVDQMLKGAATFASAYQVSSTTTPSVLAGGPTVTTVKAIAAATGVGVPNLAVSFAYPGAAPQTVRTGPDGVAAATFATSAEGPRTTEVTIANVPENRLLVLNPTDGRSSRVVVAAQKSDRVLTGVTQVTRNRPTLAVAAATRATDQAFGSVVDVAGAGAETRQLDASLHGPFASPGAVTCAGSVVKQGTVAVSAKGSFPLPAYSTATSGFYVWSVSLPGTVSDAPASACTGIVQVAQNAPRLSVTGGTVSANQTFGSVVNVASTGGAPKQLSATLYGPFATSGAVSCGGPVVKQGTVAVTSSGDYALPSYAATLAGFYIWAVSLPGNASDADASTCAGTTLVKATPSASVAPNAYSIRAGQSIPANVSAFNLPPNYTPNGQVTVFAWGPFYSQMGPAANCNGQFYTGSAVPVYVDGNGTLTATNTSNAMTFQNQYINANANYFFTVVFPADAYGRSDAFSTGCFVTNAAGNMFTNGLSVSG